MDEPTIISGSGVFTRFGAVLAAIASFLLVWIFGPNLIWNDNQNEFNFEIGELLPFLFDWKIGIMTLAVGIAVAILPEKYFRFGLAILLSLFIITFVEFNLFQGENRLIGNDGEGVNIDTSNQLLPVVSHATIFLLCLLFRKYLTGWVTLSLAIFILIQSSSLLSTPATIKKDSFDINELTAFSQNENIIHIILDELQSSFFIETLESEFSGYEQNLSGFTYYKDHLGLYPTTRTAVGYLFTDTVWKNQISLYKVPEKSANGNMFRDLAAKGYVVDVVSFPSYTSDVSTENMRIAGIPIPYDNSNSKTGKTNKAKRLEASLLLELSKSRAILDKLKVTFDISTEKIGNNKSTKKNIKSLAGAEYLNERLRANIAFFDEVIKRAYVGDTKPRYKLFHLVTTHNPASVNADCSVSDHPRKGLYADYIPQATCVLKQMFSFFEKLERLGVYDNSTIIVHADHGKRVAQDASRHLKGHYGGDALASTQYPDGLSQVIASSLPVLLIKPKGEQGVFKVSNAPVWYKDIPATIRKLAGVPLKQNERSVMDIAEGLRAERFFYYYPYSERTSGFSDRLIKYKVVGPAWKAESWEKVKEYPSPEQDYSLSYIDMGTREVRHLERDYWLQGRGKGGIPVGYSIGPVASIAYKFMKKRDYYLEVNMYATVKNQVVDVYVNNIQVGTINLSNKLDTYKILVPSAVLPKDNSELSIIEFKVAKMNVRESTDEKAERQHGIAVSWIKIY